MGKYIPLIEAEALARDMLAPSERYWRREVLLRGYPSCVPLDLKHAYKDDPNWRGKLVFFREARFVSFTKARRYARSLGLRSLEEWYEWYDLGKCPVTIRRNPYLYDEFEGIADWLRGYCRYCDGRIFMQGLTWMHSDSGFMECGTRTGVYALPLPAGVMRVIDVRLR